MMRSRLVGPRWLRASPCCRRLLLCSLLAASLTAAQSPRSRATAAGWQVVVPSTLGPGPRSQYGMAADGHGHLFLYGGNAGQDTALGDFWEYDAATDGWQALPNGVVPPLIEPHLAVDAQGQVWEFGGIAGPDAPHLTADGHSYGLYEYQPAAGGWRDLTPGDAVPGQDWPPGREDHGFAFDPRADDLVVFAGEGQGDTTLDDMWTYSLQAGTWAQVDQQYAGSGGAAIAPREIYNISADADGHLYLFGGAYLSPPYGVGTNGYANDLWRYDDATQTWTLLAGVPNGYDPTQPLPRHYYGQTIDGEGDFDVLGGYLDEPDAPLFFGQNADGRYALPFQFAGDPVPDSYGLDDLWQFDPASGWRDRSDALGALAGSPMIPYMMVADQLTDRLYTFGGFHLGQDGFLAPSDTLWSLDEGDLLGQPPTATPTESPVPSSTPTATAILSPSVTATPTMVRFPPATPPARAAAPATQVPGGGDTVTKTLLAGPYKLTLAIGPPEPLYSPAQIRAQHPAHGEKVVSGPQPTGPARPEGQAPNRHLELSVQVAASGKAVTNVEVAITITTPAGKVVQRVPVLLLERIARGPDPWHFGNNLTLPPGRYHVLVRAGQATATFDVALSR